MPHKPAFTFSNAVWSQIIARWGSEKAWKEWVKKMTLLESAPGTMHTDHTERY